MISEMSLEFIFKILSVILQHASQFVSHFFGDVASDFLHVAVRLQIASTDIQRDVLGIKSHHGAWSEIQEQCLPRCP